MNIAMWSGPRNLSTAMMYAFAQRADCTVVDEPFYAAYLTASGLTHPMQDAILAAQNSDPVGVAADCAAVGPRSLFYQKHMTHHMLPGFPRGFLAACINVFLIRHPARVIASYAAKRENPTLTDLGFLQQADLFDQVADGLGQAPIVIDSADVRANPKQSLTRLCAALNIPFDPAMLGWTPGPKPYDGVWALHWYGAIHRSTGFDSAEAALPALPSDLQHLCDAALPIFDRLARHRLQ
jgi:hypothetical protein